MKMFKKDGDPKKKIKTAVKKTAKSATKEGGSEAMQSMVKPKRVSTLKRIVKDVPMKRVPVSTLTRSVKTVMKPASGDSLKPSIKLPDPMTSFKSGMSEARKQALMKSPSPKGPNALRSYSPKKPSKLKEAVKSISPSSLKSKASSIKEEYKSRTISKKPYGK
jgi:hypothetical protein